jgi:hypothetical protein
VFTSDGGVPSVGHVENLFSHSSVLKRKQTFAIFVCLKDQPRGHSLIGESSARSSSSSPSKFATFVNI